MKRSLALGLVLVTSSFVVTAARSMAAPGDLDTTFAGFGNGGTIQIPGFAISAIAVDAQGRLVLAGTCNNTFCVQRRSGPRFLTIENSQPIMIDDGQVSATAAALAISQDGYIVIAGTLALKDRAPDFAVARLRPDLTLDVTFAGDGTTSSDFDSGDDIAFSVAVQSDNRIVVAGEVSINHGGVERFNANGTLDRESFNGNGKVVLDDVVEGVALAGDKIVLVGSVFHAFGNETLAVTRLNADGSSDGNFGDDGRAEVDFDEPYVQAKSLALGPDGRIVALGDNFGDRMLLARYLTNGALDPAFGSGGKVTNEIPGGKTSAVIVQPDSKVVVAGKLVTLGPNSFFLLRFNADGSPDSTFGDRGLVTPTFIAGAGTLALALQTDGMLIAAGDAHAERYRWDGSLDVGGIAQVVFDPAQVSSEVTALAVQENGQLLAAGNVLTADEDMALARFTADRSGLDVTYGTDTPKSGHTFYGLFKEDEEVHAMALRTDGKAVVAGSVRTAQNDNMMIGRFNTDGTADTFCAGKGFNDVDLGFGTNSASAVAIVGDKVYVAGTVRGPTNDDFGLVRFTDTCGVDVNLASLPYKGVFDLGGDDTVAGMVIDANERPVLAGTSGNDIVLIRIVGASLPIFLNGLPRIDTSFGVDGKATLELGGGVFAAGLAQQHDGKLIVAGRAQMSGGITHFLVARFTADGQLDTTFGDGGSTVVGFNPVDAATALAVRSDDSIAVVGSTTIVTGAHVFAVALFTAAGQPDTRFNDTGTATLRIGPDGEDVAQAVVFQEPNHLAVGGYSTAFGVHRFAVAAFETTHAAPLACVGDCDGSGTLTVDELVKGVNIALGVTMLGDCPAFNCNGTGHVTVDCLVQAVNNALNGCAEP